MHRVGKPELNELLSDVDDEHPESAEPSSRQRPPPHAPLDNHHTASAALTSMTLRGGCRDAPLSRLSGGNSTTHWGFVVGFEHNVLA